MSSDFQSGDYANAIRNLERRIYEPDKVHETVKKIFERLRSAYLYGLPTSRIQLNSKIFNGVVVNQVNEKLASVGSNYRVLHSKFDEYFLVYG
jgi:hypothetical protein